MSGVLSQDSTPPDEHLRSNADQPIDLASRSLPTTKSQVVAAANNDNTKQSFGPTLPRVQPSTPLIPVNPHPGQTIFTPAPPAANMTTGVRQSTPVPVAAGVRHPGAVSVPNTAALVRGQTITAQVRNPTLSIAGTSTSQKQTVPRALPPGTVLVKPQMISQPGISGITGSTILPKQANAVPPTRTRASISVQPTTVAITRGVTAFPSHVPRGAAAIASITAAPKLGAIVNKATASPIAALPVSIPATSLPVSISTTTSLPVLAPVSISSASAVVSASSASGTTTTPSQPITMSHIPVGVRASAALTPVRGAVAFPQVVKVSASQQQLGAGVVLQSATSIPQQQQIVVTPPNVIGATTATSAPTVTVSLPQSAVAFSAVVPQSQHQQTTSGASVVLDLQKSTQMALVTGTANVQMSQASDLPRVPQITVSVPTTGKNASQLFVQSADKSGNPGGGTFFKAGQGGGGPMTIQTTKGGNKAPTVTVALPANISSAPMSSAMIGSSPSSAAAALLTPLSPAGGIRAVFAPIKSGNAGQTVTGTPVQGNSTILTVVSAPQQMVVSKGVNLVSTTQASVRKNLSGSSSASIATSASLPTVAIPIAKVFPQPLQQPSTTASAVSGPGSGSVSGSGDISVTAATSVSAATATLSLPPGSISFMPSMTGTTPGEARGLPPTGTATVVLSTPGSSQNASGQLSRTGENLPSTTTTYTAMPTAYFYESYPNVIPMHHYAPMTCGASATTASITTNMASAPPMIRSRLPLIVTATNSTNSPNMTNLVTPRGATTGTAVSLMTAVNLNAARPIISQSPLMVTVEPKQPFLPSVHAVATAISGSTTGGSTLNPGPGVSGSGVVPVSSSISSSSISLPTSQITAFSSSVPSVVSTSASSGFTVQVPSSNKLAAMETLPPSPGRQSGVASPPPTSSTNGGSSFCTMPPSSPTMVNSTGNSATAQVSATMSPSTRPPSILRKRVAEGSAINVKKNLLLSSIGSQHGDMLSRGLNNPDSRPASNGSSQSSFPEEITVKQEIPDEPQMYNGSILSSVDASPRKKPRKQHLAADENVGIRAAEGMMLGTSGAIGGEDCRRNGDLSAEALSARLATLEGHRIKHEAMEQGDEMNHSHLTNQWSPRYNRPVLYAPSGTYKMSKHNHFIRYTDVRSKDENKKPTASELSNQKGVMQKANGWKVFHLANQMDELMCMEDNVYQKLSELLQFIDARPNTLIRGKPLEAEEEKMLAKINELVKGSLQRSKIVQDQVREAKQHVLKVLDHKDPVCGVISKYVSKRPHKKRDKL